VIVPCPCGGAVGTNKVQFSRSRRAEEAEEAVAVSSTGPKTQTTLQLHCQKKYTGKHMKEDEHCAGLGWAGLATGALCTQIATIYLSQASLDGCMGTTKLTILHHFWLFCFMKFCAPPALCSRVVCVRESWRDAPPLSLSLSLCLQTNHY